MFSISFGEMMVILIMGLLVIGPSRLPATARFLGHLIGRIQRQVSSVKRDIKREMDLSELREMQDGYEKASHAFSKTMHSQVAESGKPDTTSADKKPEPVSAEKPKKPEVPAPQQG